MAYAPILNRSGRPAHVAHITSVHPAFDVRIFLKECRSLAAAGLDVSLVAPHDGDLERDGVRIAAIRRARSRPERMIGAAPAALRRAAALRADIYHIHDPELLPGSLALQRWTGAPVIYDSHEYLVEDVATKAWLAPAVARALSHVVGGVESFVAKRLGGIIAVNPHMAERFSRLNANVGVVANYPYRSMAEWTDSIPADDQSIIYVGPLDRDRGLLTVVETMKTLRRERPSATCGILGGLDFANVRTTAAETRLEGIAELGRVPHAELGRVVRRHAIGWLPWTDAPAYFRGTPTKLMEYMALGLPVVASSLPFVAEIVRAADCGILVAPRDAAEHAGAIRALWADPERARRLGENGRRAIIEWLNWESQIPALLDTYRRALDTFHSRER